MEHGTKMYIAHSDVQQVSLIYHEKYIHLSDIELLFKSMGFKHVYIYDPSCRDCEIDPELADKYKNLERTYPSNSPITTQPTNYIPKNTSNTNNTTGNSFVNDCVNGVCKIFQKTKVDGGTSRYLNTKTKHKKRKTKKYRKRKTKKYFKKTNKTK